MFAGKYPLFSLIFFGVVILKGNPITGKIGNLYVIPKGLEGLRFGGDFYLYCKVAYSNHLKTTGVGVGLKHHNRLSGTNFKLFKVIKDCFLLVALLLGISWAIVIYTNLCILT